MIRRLDRLSVVSWPSWPVRFDRCPIVSLISAMWLTSGLWLDLNPAKCVGDRRFVSPFQPHVSSNTRH